MPRKPAKIIQVNLRVQEALRQRLEKAALANGATFNGEMVRRLEASLQADSQRIVEITAQDMAGHWARFGEFFHKIANQNALGSAAEALVAAVEALPAKCQSEDVRTAVAAVRQWLTVIDHERAIALRKVEHGA
jgi:hypothetical protein